MSKLIETVKAQIPNDFFTTAELMRILLKSPDGHYGLVKRAIAKGDIIRIRRGLYVLSKRHQRNGIDLFELAQTIHRWIPEGVQTTTSVSQNRSIEFRTPLGVFSYSRMPKFNYIGVERISS